MKERFLWLGAVLGFALVAVAVLAFAVTQAEASHQTGERGAVQQAGRPEPVADDGSDIRARRIISPDIGSPLALSENGRKLIVTGHFGCTRGEDYEIQTLVTQSATGAMARGRVQGQCSGREGEFAAPTWVYDEALFTPGLAQACAMLITRRADKVTDVYQWCRKTDPTLATRSAVY